jgi:ligand-binding sensor domain-containing protein/DNA-binding CsgD family transcriptional regulator
MAQGNFLGVPSIAYFGEKDYQAHISNHKIRQDSRGLIFVANKIGMLVYDGSQWRLHYVSWGERGITSLLTDDSGRVYASSRNIGYYFPDSSGDYKFHSLDHLLPSDHRVRSIVKTIPYKNGYVFVSTHNLYFYDGETIEILPTEVLPPRSMHVYNCGGELYMNPNGKGLAVLNGRNWKLLTHGSKLAQMNITSLIEKKRGSLLVFTENNGIYQIKDNDMAPFAGALHEELSNRKINAVTKLSNGHYAIGSNNNGLYIIDDNGDLVYHLDSTKGLNTSSIRDVFEDADGNIWLARENGIVKIGWRSAQSYLREELNLPGVGYTAIAFGDHFYFGTSTGLYRAKKQWPIDKVEAIENVQGPVYYLQNIHGDLLVSGVNNSFQLYNGKFIPISSDQDWMHFAFKETSDPNVLIRGSLSGIYRIEKKNGRWAETHKYKKFEEWTKFMEFDKNGKLWTATSFRGICSFTFSEDYSTITAMKFYAPGESGLPNTFSRIFKLDDQILITNTEGVYSFIEEEERFQIASDWQKTFEDKNDSSKNDVYEVVGDEFGNVYYSAARSNGRLTKNIGGSYSRESYLIDGFQHHWEGRLSVLDESNILYAQSKGFIHFNRDAYEDTKRIPELLIRYVRLTKSDSLLFGGNYLDGFTVVTKQPEDQTPTLSFDNNSLVIGYSAIEYNEHQSTYRHRLDGFEEDWSEWTTKTEKEYSYLPQGNYTFRVQVRNANNELSAIEFFAFEILPPWYKTNIAYVSYGLGIIGLMVFIILINRKKYKEEIDELKKANIETEIQHKKKQLATTTMHLVEKTNFINSVKTKLGEVLDTKKEKDIHLGIRRVIKSIERNVAEDKHWEEFEQHFDEVHHGFLKKLRNNFPTITPQEIKLSAYLRLNLTTKEIANLLKVSVRAVEMARFRLRRRLDVGKEESLVSFMLNI